MAPICPKCGKEMKQVDDYWVCGNHPDPVFIRIESISTPSVHTFSELCAVLPTPIAFVLDEFFREGNAFVALWRMVDAGEIITRFFTIIALSDILRHNNKFPEDVQDALTDKLERPTFGAWKELLAIAIDNLPKERGQTRCFVSELPSFVRDKWLPELGSGEDKPEEKLIALRNLIAHAGRLPDEKAQELLNAHRQRFESLAKELSFLANYDLIACTKEGQIVWLKGLPSANSAFPDYDRPLSFVPEHGRVYLVRDGKGIDLFPLHAFTDILQWREERYEFEGLGEVAPQIYFRLSERGYLECIPFGTKAIFSHLGEDAYQYFCKIFQLEEWRVQRRLKAEAQGIQKLWDEQIRELTEVLVGRDKHIRQVKDAIKRSSKGVLWISGKPGVGKSALMAKLMKDYIGQTQHYIVIPYFFRYGQAGCSTMDFLATALKRLKAELNREIEPEPRLPDRQRQLVETLEEAVSETGKKVLFLVDGLDEIYRHEREFLNVPFMTVREGILWVCAGRSEGDLEEALKSRGAVWVFPDGLPGLDEQAIRAMLIEHLGRLKYALFERDEGERNRFVEAVADKSEGLPLYVRMVIEDLKAGQLTVRDEGKLPDGWEKYCDQLLERLRVHSAGGVLTPLVCLLAWAKEPTTEGTMKVLLQPHHLANEPDWDDVFRKVLKHGYLVLQQRPTLDGESGWTIYHDSFRQHLLKSKTVEPDRKWAQRRWLEVCKDWKALASQEPSLYRYILRHYAEHLREAKRWDELFALARDDAFCQAQAQASPTDPDLLLRTVQEALLGAAERDDAVAMAEFLLKHARRLNEIVQESPLDALRRTGRVERAWRLADLYDVKRCLLWHLLLAWELKETCPEKAQKTLQRLYGRSLPEFDLIGGPQDWECKMAVFLLIEVWEVVKEISTELSEEALSERGRRELCAQLVQREQFDEALKVVRGIKEVEFIKADALRKIVEGLAQVGRVDRALEIAERVKLAESKARALAAIAAGLAQAKEKVRAKEVLEHALKVAEKIEWNGEKAKVLREIAAVLARMGQFDEALKVAERIIEDRRKAEALAAIATELTQTGEKERAKEVFEYALKVAERDVTDAKGKALVEIATGLTQAGELEQALKVAEGIKWAHVKLEVLVAIAQSLAQMGERKQAKEVFDKALEIPEGKWWAGWKAEALRKIAVGLAQAGEREWAKEILEQALKVTERIENDPTHKADALVEIAEKLSQMGEKEWAEEVLGQALMEAERSQEFEIRHKAETLAAIAALLARTGEKKQAKKVSEQALKVAAEIKDRAEKYWALCEIAKQLAQGGQVDETLKATAMIMMEWREGVEEVVAVNKAEALATIGKGLAQAGEKEAAKQVLEHALRVVARANIQRWTFGKAS